MMLLNRRLRWIWSFGLLAVVALITVVQSWADDPGTEPNSPVKVAARPRSSLQLNKMTHQQRAQVVGNMNLVEKEELRKKWEKFKGLDEDAKSRKRQFHQQVMVDPQANRLHQVMVRYHEWLGSLRSSQRADLLSLKAEERIKRIQQIIKEQEQRKFTELLERELAAEDLSSILKWTEGYLVKCVKKIESHEEEIIANLDAEQQVRLKRIRDPAQRRRALALGSLFSSRLEPVESKPDRLLPSKEDFQQLREGLSQRGRDLFDKAEGAQEQLVLVRQWTRAAWMSRRKALPKVSDETLEAFRRDELDFKLTAEDRERLERLSGEPLKQQLKWYYYRYRGDLEPGGRSRVGSRAGSRGGRTNGGGRGNGRPPSSPGRPRSPQRGSNQINDRPLNPSRPQS